MLTSLPMFDLVAGFCLLGNIQGQRSHDPLIGNDCGWDTHAVSSCGVCAIGNQGHCHIGYLDLVNHKGSLTAECWFVVQY